MTKENLEDVMLCVWKNISNNPDSSTFKEVKDKSHGLYKCYDCIGIGVNVCENYKPYYRMNRINGDYR